MGFLLADFYRTLSTIDLILSDSNRSTIKSHKNDAVHAAISSVDKSRVVCAWLNFTIKTPYEQQKIEEIRANLMTC